MGKGKDRKGPQRILTVSSTTPDYRSPAHLPWQEIEALVGVGFSDAARTAIFEAREQYRESLDQYCNAPALRETEDLRDELLSLCRRLHRIYVVVHQHNNPDTDEATTERAFDGLAWWHGGNLRDALTQVAQGCAEIDSVLSREPDDFAVITMHRPPEVMAFDEFYGRLTDAGDALGFRLSEKSERFVRLVGWVAASVGQYADAATVKGARGRRMRRKRRQGPK